MVKLTGFNWSELTRSAIIQMVFLCKDQIVNQSLQVNQLHKILSIHIKKYIPVTIHKQTRKKTEAGLVYVGGLYYSEYDQAGTKPIKVVLQYNPSDVHIMVTAIRFKKIAILIADTILHEIIHMRQYRRRSFNDGLEYVGTANNYTQCADQSYLGKTDEIDAYGFNIACELDLKFKSDEHAITEYLNSCPSLTVKEKSNWIKYLVAFDNNHNHPKIKQLKKKILHHLPNAKLGKPYTNSNWLTN